MTPSRPVKDPQLATMNMRARRDQSAAFETECNRYIHNRREALRLGRFHWSTLSSSSFDNGITPAFIHVDVDASVRLKRELREGFYVLKLRNIERAEVRSAA